MKRTRKIRVAVQMDPLASLRPKTDSTLYLLAAAKRRGFEIFHYRPQNLSMDIGKKGARITARGNALLHKNGAWAYGVESVKRLEDFDIILMRQDPPFDLAYISATHILEHLKGRVRVVNDPVAVRNAPEKLLVPHFPHLMPPTLVTRDCKAVADFRARHGEIVFKPLFGWAGHGIFHLRPDDDNMHSLLEMMGDFNQEPWMIQKYLPEIKKGDKRIILLDGEPVGAVNRIPLRGESRGSMRVGAKPVRTTLTKRDREICAALAPLLRAAGLFFVGIDVIGNYLTEINVTSPTGIVSADVLSGNRGKDSIAERFWDMLLK